jgi:hypothetical protein
LTRQTQTNQRDQNPRRAQSGRILEMLRAADGGWVALPDILALRISQYGARILELRRAGHLIQNRTQYIAGVRHSWFRLVSSGDLTRQQVTPRGPVRRFLAKHAMPSKSISQPETTARTASSEDFGQTRK